MTVRNALELPPIHDAEQFTKGGDSHNMKRRFRCLGLYWKKNCVHESDILEDIVNRQWVSTTKASTVCCVEGLHHTLQRECQSEAPLPLLWCLGVMIAQGIDFMGRAAADYNDPNPKYPQESGANGVSSENKQGYESASLCIAMSVEERKKLHASNL